MTVRPSRLGAALTGVLVAFVVTLSGCAGRAPDSSSAGSSGAASNSSSTTGDQRVEVTFAHGTAGGDTGRVSVAKGTAVTLVVTSDVADEVHVHGYDIESEVTAGKPVTLKFDAAISGVFEVELHHADTVLLRLQVS